MLDLMEIVVLNACATVSLLNAVFRWNLETRYKRHEFQNRMKEADPRACIGHVPL